MAVVTIKKGREKALRHRHPWVFSGAVESVEGDVDPGAVVDLVDAKGTFLARGYYNDRSRIRVRVLTWDKGVAIDDGLWRDRVFASVDRRAMLADDPDTNAYRLVHAEADLLPGVVADRYNDVVVVQLLTAGAERAREAILDALEERLQPAAVYDRSDTASRTREGLTPTEGVVRGDAGREAAEIVENGHAFTVSLTSGQKTGFYLDQRENRHVVAGMSAGRRVLDAFCYTGAFSVYAMKAGAESVALVDSSEASLVAAEKHLERAAVDPARAELIQADVFELLRAWRSEGKRFDLAVLDPPRFALNQHQVDGALRGYKDINMLAMALLEPGGILATFSCSGAVDVAAFTRAVSWAGIDSGRDIQILRRLSQGPDHPALATFPESEYLKGIVCRVV